MKEKLVQISMLSGFYLIISFFLGLFDNDFLSMLDIVLLFALIVWIVVLFFIKPLNFLNRFRNKFPKISIYLISVGWTICLLFPILLLGGVLGYNAAMAKYNGTVYDGENIQLIFGWLLVIDLFAVAASLVVATVIIARRLIKDKIKA